MRDFEPFAVAEAIMLGLFESGSITSQAMRKVAARLRENTNRTRANNWHDATERFEDLADTLERAAEPR